jgi:transcriptional regulator with XRE-family HTH domain
MGVTSLSILGSSIRKLREQRGLTQAHFGEIIGVAESTVSLYESGKREPDIAMLTRIADYLGQSIDHLLGRDTSAKATDTFTIASSSMQKTFESLSPSNQKLVIEFIKMLLKQEKENK